ncbi:hypothetical protein C2845_PM15G26090 [Panicum miliaceum]|uniref:Uncharacterized protein n=1 Tax=Panicum miliaceum TaxID=4540 RepID=A0A3L6Q6X0_PANMI|nr:hypothetical protein C2845_PM15G26090 [Panicum miliaceum]
MATLRPCPSVHVVVGAGRPCISSPPSSSLRIVPALGRQGGRSTALVGHWLAGRAAPRLRDRHATGARKGAADWPFGVEPNDGNHMTDELFKKLDEELKKHCELDKDMLFREEIETICEYWKKMTSWDTSIFDMEATALSLHLCMVATKGVKLASRIMDSAALRLDKQDEISLHTTKQTLAMYVSVFVKLAEDTNHKKFNDESVFSLLGAFKGVAAIGHILVKDALESVNYVEYGSSNYSFLVQDTGNSWHEYEQNINNLEDKFRAALKNNSKMYEASRGGMPQGLQVKGNLTPAHQYMRVVAIENPVSDEMDAG